MEVKTLLRIIKDDVAHLESITGEFNLYSLPSPDEIDVALVRANALLRELGLLHKLATQHEGSYKSIQPQEQARAEVSDHHHLEQELPELIDKESSDVEKVNNPDKEQTDFVPAVEVRDNVIVEPKVPGSDENAVVESVIVSVITDQIEKVVAEEFKEEKKTLNETLGEPHQLVNDFLTPDKAGTGYPIIPINSIWDGIGINDRFLFIRELFANNSTKFASTVEAIDQLGSIHEAVNYLKMNFKWNKTEASQKFLVLVKRRFTK